jgi:hypothetical protein
VGHRGCRLRRGRRDRQRRQLHRDVELKITPPHPAFGHPLPAPRGEGHSRRAYVESPSPRAAGRGALAARVRREPFSPLAARRCPKGG